MKYLQDIQQHGRARPVARSTSASVFNRWQHHEPLCPNVQRILADALVNQRFCQALLACPAQAIELYVLTAEERRVLSGIRVTTLQDFAAAVEAWRLTQTVNDRSEPQAGVDELLSATA